jgi:ribosomal subunit interface protein
MGSLNVRVTGRNIDVGEALRGKIEDDLEAGISRYVTRDGDAVVTLTKERHLILVELHVHLDSGISLEANGSAGEAHAAFADALVKIEKRARRYKRRLKDHHAHQRNPLPREEIVSYVIEPEEEADDEASAGEAGPLVVAETVAVLKTMPVATAVMQLELSDSPVVLFRNPKSGVLNAVYNRPDGNIGWIDPGPGVSG